MLTGGLQKLTTLDFPGVVSSIVFTKGCNFRCPYCHNPELVALGFYLKNPKHQSTSDADLMPHATGQPTQAATVQEAATTVPANASQLLEHSSAAQTSHGQAATSAPSPYCGNLEPRAEMEELFRFLHKRQGLIDGLVISGGEPCLQPDLPEFCREVRKLGYKIKLDTNGSRPQMLQTLLDSSLLDYVAMDLKTLPAAYFKYGFCREADIESRLLQTMDILRDCGLPYEYRTTCVAPFIDREIILELAQLIGASGRTGMAGAAKTDTPWYFQKARLNNVLSPETPMEALSDETVAELVAEAAKLAPKAALRGE
ncbi:anaerobic ribonucleoside-triphosphate reductase activating protein [Desulfovibrio sp. OttesenSCG-928-C06]|nr:anaerobic ribonucleoside-triphosphate reductase activating protein [Desulfovibrio sp. OttesenSCG-928-C06]